MRLMLLLLLWRRGLRLRLHLRLHLPLQLRLRWHLLLRLRLWCRLWLRLFNLYCGARRPSREHVESSTGSDSPLLADEEDFSIGSKAPFLNIMLGGASGVDLGSSGVGALFLSRTCGDCG
jgi:hypothetical protein